MASDQPEGLSLSTIVDALLAITGFLACMIFNRFSSRMDRMDEKQEDQGEELAALKERQISTENRVDKLED